MGGLWGKWRLAQMYWEAVGINFGQEKQRIPSRIISLGPWFVGLKWKRRLVNLKWGYDVCQYLSLFILYLDFFLEFTACLEWSLLRFVDWIYCMLSLGAWVRMVLLLQLCYVFHLCDLGMGFLPFWCKCGFGLFKQLCLAHFGLLS